MTTALVSPSTPALIVYAASLVVVVWAVADAARRPASQLPTNRKLGWILGSAVGWLLFGIVGAAVAIVYLVGPRKRMNIQRW
jgi:hypothetical protein